MRLYALWGLELLTRFTATECAVAHAQEFLWGRSFGHLPASGSVLLCVNLCALYGYTVDQLVHRNANSGNTMNIGAEKSAASTLRRIVNVLFVRTK